MFGEQNSLNKEERRIFSPIGRDLRAAIKPSWRNPVLYITNCSLLAKTVLVFSVLSHMNRYPKLVHI